MSDKEKIKAILKLLTDRTCGILTKKKQLKNKDEEFGSLVTLGHVFRKAYKIARG